MTVERITAPLHVSIQGELGCATSLATGADTHRTPTTLQQESASRDAASGTCSTKGNIHCDRCWAGYGRLRAAQPVYDLHQCGIPLASQARVTSKRHCYFALETYHFAWFERTLVQLAAQVHREEQFLAKDKVQMIAHA